MALRWAGAAMQEAAKGFRQGPQAIAALEGRAHRAKGAGNFREPASCPKRQRLCRLSIRDARFWIFNIKRDISWWVPHDE
jgi:hypothetical protein